MGEEKYKLRGGNVVKYRGYDGWRARVSYHDSEGNRKEKTRTFKVKGKKEAKALALAWVDELNQQANLKPTPANTIGEYVSVYIDTQEGNIDASTVTYYRKLTRLIVDGLGEVALNDLTADMVNAWMARQAKHYAPKTVNGARQLLKAAMNDALLNGRIISNPLLLVKKLKEPRREPNALTVQGRAAVLADIDGFKQATAQDAPSNLGTKLALFTGMRQGEICGLRWCDVDFQSQTLRVVKSIGRAAGKTYPKEPKTGGSRRAIPIPSVLMDELRDRKRDMQKQCLAAGVSWRGTFYVLGEIDGSYLRPDSLSRSWRRRVKRLGLIGTQGTPPTFHDLRHTFATTAIANGADVKSVSSILGHSNAAMTLNIYASADPQATRRTMDDVEAALLAPAPTAAIIELAPTGTGE